VKESEYWLENIEKIKIERKNDFGYFSRGTKKKRDAPSASRR
jgi:hypothetical protein